MKKIKSFIFFLIAFSLIIIISFGMISVSFATESSELTSVEETSSEIETTEGATDVPVTEEETTAKPDFRPLADTSYNLGDVDFNGKINSVDARMVLRFSVELEQFNEDQVNYADYIGDGTIRANDARMILRTAVELEAFRGVNEKLDKNPPSMEELKEQWLNSFPDSVSKDELVSNINWLVNDVGIRNWHNSNRNYSADLIYDVLISYGYTADTCKKLDFYRNDLLGRNVMAVIPTAKENSDVIVVSAHYDTVAGTAGAVDNSSGTVTLLQLAKQFIAKGQDFGVELRFIFFAGEEQGYYGAYAYVNSLSAEEKARHKIIFNMDMTGKPNNNYVPDRSYYITVSTEPVSTNSYSAPAAQSNIGSDALDYARNALGISGASGYYSPVRAGLHDIVPFRKAGMPALTLSWRQYDKDRSSGADYGLASPSLIHTTSDNLSNFDYDSHYNTTRLASFAVAKLVSAYIEKF